MCFVGSKNGFKVLSVKNLRIFISLSSLLFLLGCGPSSGQKEQWSIVSAPEAPQFEVRDFVVTEKKEAATQYIKEWNKFNGSGTIVARNVDKDRNLSVLLEIRDETAGPSAEPAIEAVLLRGGIGTVKTYKGNFQEVSVPPKYSWKVIGWFELHKATIEAPR